MICVIYSRKYFQRKGGSGMDGDALLVYRMKNGDEDAIEQFVRKYYSVILKYCRYHIPDTGYAEDMTQETFERFFRTLPNYRHYGKALNYLYVVAGNLCRDFYRRMGTEQAADQKNDMSDESPGKRSALEGQCDPFDGLDGRMDLGRAVAMLPADLKEVIILYYFQELKLKEIAAVLEIGLPLVKYRLKKAKERLEKLLGE